MTWRTIGLLAVAAAAVALGGCAQTRTYQVAVRNETSQPITLGFAKEEGGPYEPQWATPEQVAIESPSYSDRSWDSVVVPPGRTGVAGPIEGKFDGSARAFLRVYEGELKLNDVLAVSRGSPRRVDVPLAAGKNALIVHEDAGKLAVERVQLSPKKS